MNGIDKKDFCKLIEMMPNSVIFEDNVAKLFEKYGDDWYINESHSGFVLTNKNKLLKQELEERFNGKDA